MVKNQTAAAWVAAESCVRFLAQELLYAMDAALKKKKNQWRWEWYRQFLNSSETAQRITCDSFLTTGGNVCP